ncbi:MAG: hypothetical protein ABIG89_06760 [Candidatus Woesearchaeota archaeon]
MLNKSITLKHYKRNDVQAAILASCKDREVATRFDYGFGKRPDILSYPNDILELAKQGATSFHVSEEHWDNVLALRPELNKKDLDNLRIGWDLVLDVDCKYWYYSKLITHLLIRQLREHGISSITVKFSGSKGFHIGVPFDVFPNTFPLQGKPTETRLLFPEAPKRIALFLKDKIEPLFLKELRKDMNDRQLADMVGVSESELVKTFCKNCGAEPKEISDDIYFICPGCQTKSQIDDNNNQVDNDKVDNVGRVKYKQCPNCNTFMEQIEPKKIRRCYRCDSTDFEEKFDSALILDIDTILISSRHMYRMPYSLHEKSGLCSIVIDPDKVMEFEKEQAVPSNVVPNMRFLDTTYTKEGEATRLIIEAFDYKPVFEQRDSDLSNNKKEYEVPEEAIPVSMFPPCILKGLEGVQDGRKRFMFALLNFLECCGYNHDTISAIVKEWNLKNAEPLREVIINSQLRYRKQQRKDKILPPNCMQSYQEINLCYPDNFCRRIKNPVQYAKTNAFIANKEANKGRPKLTEEQKEMRKKHREKLKKEKQMKEEIELEMKKEMKINNDMIIKKKGMGEKENKLKKEANLGYNHLNNKSKID